MGNYLLDWFGSDPNPIPAIDLSYLYNKVTLTIGYAGVYADVPPS